MRFAILFCFAFIAAARADSMQEISTGLDQAQKVIDVTTAKANELRYETITAVNAETKKIRARVEEFFAEFNEKFDEIFNNPKNREAFECHEQAKSLRDSVLQASSEASRCLREKIPMALHYVQEISKSSSVVLDELQQTRIEARNCMENDGAFEDLTSAIECLTQAGSNASWVSVKKLTEIAMTFGKLASYVGSLPESLQSCGVSTGFNDIIGGIDGDFEHIKSCYERVSTN